MNGIILFVLCTALTFSPLFRSDAAELPAEIDPAPVGIEYSDSTLLLSVSADASKEALAALFEQYGFEVLYDMENLSMYAVKLPRPMTVAELDALIEELERSELIVAAHKDEIIRLDDPILPPVLAE